MNAKKKLKKENKIAGMLENFTFKKGIIWIFIPFLSIVVIAAIVISLYYYFFTYTVPGFSDLTQNYISSNTDDNIVPGDEISYTINFKNTGNRDADNFEIKAKLPTDTSFGSSDIEVLAGDDGEILIFNIGQLAKDEAGTANFSIITDMPLEAGTRIIWDNIEFSYMIGDQPYSQIITADLNHTIDSSPDFNSFDLKAVDENGGYLKMGDTIEYTLSFENRGNMNAASVEVKSMLSENVSVSEGSITGPGILSGNAVVWNLDNIEINKPYIFKFKAVVGYDLSDGELIEDNSILTYGGDVKIEKSASDPVSLFPDLSGSGAFLSDDNGGDLWAGETINIKIVIKNSGESGADSYRLICPTPDNTVYISRSGTPEGISWSDEVRGLVWDLSSLGAGEQKEIDFQVQVSGDLYYTGGTISTNFKIENDGKETEVAQASINVKRFTYMTIVAMGDSLISKSDWVQRFDQLLESAFPLADYNTIPSGVSGEMAFQGHARFDSTVAIYNPQIIIIAYGTNDVGSSYSYFSASLEGMVMKAKNLGATVFLNMVGPINTEGKENWEVFDRAIMEVSAKQGVPVINIVSALSRNPGKYLYSDGMHYTPDGAAVVAQTVFNHVIQYLDAAGQRK